LWTKATLGTAYRYLEARNEQASHTGSVDRQYAGSQTFNGLQTPPKNAAATPRAGDAELPRTIASTMRCTCRPPQVKRAMSRRGARVIKAMQKRRRNYWRWAERTADIETARPKIHTYKGRRKYFSHSIGPQSRTGTGRHARCTCNLLYLKSENNVMAHDTTHRFVAAPALGASLARCAVQLSARPSTAGLDRTAHTTVRRLSTAASPIRYSAFFGGSEMPTQHTRSTGFLCGWSVALELSTTQHDRSGPRQEQLQTSAEDAFIYIVLKHLAYLRCFRTIRSIHWLTYLLTIVERTTR